MKKGNKSNSQHDEADFKGYSIEEIKYQRALLLLKREHSRETFLEAVDNLKKQMPFAGGHGKAGTITKGVMGKVFGSLNYVDYLLLGASLFSTGRKVISLFRKFKK